MSVASASPANRTAEPGRAADGAAFLPAIAPILVGLVAFGLARRALMPGQGFWDTGEFQFVGPLLGTAHPTGYPTYVLLSWVASIVLAPFGEPAFRMNLLAAVLLGVAAAGTTALAIRLAGGRALPGMAAGLILALSPLAWRMGTFADPHTLHLVLLLPLLGLLLGWERRHRRGTHSGDRWLVAAASAFGVAMANHSLTFLLAPGIVLFLLAVDPGLVRRWRLIGACAGALFGTAALLYLELPLRAAMGAPFVYGHPATWGGFWYVALGQQFGGSLSSPLADVGGKLSGLASLASHNLGLVAPLIPAAFVVTAVRRPRFALLTGAWLAVTCVFAMSYVNADIDRYYLGPLLVVVLWLAIAGGVVADALEGVLAGPEEEGPGEVDAADAEDAGPPDAQAPGLSRELPPAGRRARLGGLVAGALVAALLAGPALLAAPSTLAAVDGSGNTMGERWSRWAMGALPADAVVVSWWDFSTPLWYRSLVLGERPDVTIIDDRTILDLSLGDVDAVIRANLGRRPVFLIRLPDDLASLKERWRTTDVVDPNGFQPLVEVLGPTGG